MAVDSFTLEQAEAEIAEHRGQIDILGEYHGLSDSTDPPVAPGAGNGSALYSVNGVVQHMTDSGLTGPVPLTWPDTGTQTVTATSATSLSAVYTIPGGDANVGTVYRMTAWGNGTWGATQQTMAFGIGFPGVTEFGAHQAVLSTAFAASAAFRWNAILWVMCLATGVSASWHGSLNLAMSETANNLNPGTAASNTFGAAQGPSTNVTQDSTIGNALSMIAWWGSATGAPSITCHGTYVERLAA